MLMHRVSEPVLDCPSCKVAMHPAASSRDNLWLCDQCGAFFMPSKTFEGLVEEPLKKRPDAVRSASCPGCKGEMSGVEVKGAAIDLCPRCEMVHSDRASFSYIVEHSQDRPKLGMAMLGIDVARNIGNASRAEHLPNLKVDNIFILYRNGILITSYAPQIPKDMDQDVVGSMLMAVTEFVQTTFKSIGGSNPLSSIRFGDREIAFEHGQYLVLALTLKGELESDTRKKLSAALTAVEERNAHVLRSWDGDLGGLHGMLDSFRHLVEPVRA
jgi:Zn-finger nucleic acid-binding protein